MYWIIEPHADDAFLSLHEHIVYWIKQGKAVSILTVYSNPKRDGEAAEYARKVGAGYCSMTIEDQSHLGLPPKPILPFSDWGLEIDEGDQLIFPLGLQHPDHLQVRSQAPDGSWFYLDTPYQAKLKLGEDLLRRLRGRKIISMRYPGKRKWANISTFKSQAKFFHFNPPESLHRIPEIIVV